MSINLMTATGVIELSSLMGESLFACSKGLYFKTKEMENGGVVCVKFRGYDGEKVILPLNTLVTPVCFT